MKKLLTASPDIISEYCAQVVKIGEMKPIEGSDFLAKVLVGGNSMVVRKDEFKEGDYAIYCKNETELNNDFLSVNNMFELSEFEKNANKEQVKELKQQLLDLSTKQIKTEEDLSYITTLESKLKSMCGFFNKYGRVKMIRLKGTPSYGVLFKKETIANWIPEFATEDLSRYILNEEMGIGEDFDTICGVPFIKVYVPRIKTRRQNASGSSGTNKRNKKIEKFERISSNDWSFHYDSKKLNDNIWRIQPTDNVDISIKKHGTSICCGNIPVKTPIKLNIIQKCVNGLYNSVNKFTRWLEKKTKLPYVIDYGNVYSSRTVIKNKNINPKQKEGGFYGTDVWGVVNEWIKDYLEPGMMLYGEICGYLPGSNKFIQKSYDYGCKIGECFLMPYRITTKENGETREWEVQEVYNWTVKLIEEHPELKDKIHPITILYSGTLQDLYPEVNTESHWHENILENLKNDKKRFYMECNDPDCKNRVAFEGICIRKQLDEVPECFKLKSDLFFKKESEAISKGDIDTEMLENYETEEEA